MAAHVPALLGGDAVTALGPAVERAAGCSFCGPGELGFRRQVDELVGLARALTSNLRAAERGWDWETVRTRHGLDVRRVARDPGQAVQDAQRQLLELLDLRWRQVHGCPRPTGTVDPDTHAEQQRVDRAFHDIVGPQHDEDCLRRRHSDDTFWQTIAPALADVQILAPEDWPAPSSDPASGAVGRLLDRFRQRWSTPPGPSGTP